MDLLKIPSVAFSENSDYNLEACILIYFEKIKCFDLNPDGSFSAVCVYCKSKVFRSKPRKLHQEIIFKLL